MYTEKVNESSEAIPFSRYQCQLQQIVALDKVLLFPCDLRDRLINILMINTVSTKLMTEISFAYPATLFGSVTHHISG